MFDTVSGKLNEFVQFISADPVLSFVLAVYFLGFIILTLCRFWEHKLHEQESYLIDTVGFIYTPLLLIFHIMGIFRRVLKGMTDRHAQGMMTGFLKIIFFPLLLIEIIGRHINRETLSEFIKTVLSSIGGEKFVDSENKNLWKKLKIYQQCTKNLISIDASFLKDYYWENCFKFLAFLLQAVSFFTTYTGVELFFGDLFSLATLFITMVIQIGLYTTSINVNKPGKKNFRGKLLLFILLIVSITFSYVGLITLVSSPEESYEEAYKRYETAYNKSGLKPAGSFTDEIEDNVRNELKKAISTLKVLDQKILDKLKGRENLKNGGVPTRFYASVFENETIAPDGTVIHTGGAQAPNPLYTNYKNEMQQYNDDIDSLIQIRLVLMQDVCNVTGRKLNKFKKNREEESYYENMDYSTIEKSFEEADLSFLFTDDGKSAAGNSWTADRCRALIKANNSVLTNTLVDKTSRRANKITAKYIDEAMEEHKKDQALESVSLEEWEILRNLGEEEEEETITDKILNSIGAWLGADLRNADMHNLNRLLLEVQNRVRDNYNVASLYIDKMNDPQMAAELEERKEEVEQIPNLFMIGFRRFTEKGKHQNNAFICAILALFNDALTVLLGWAGSKKAFSFLYVKSSRDYYDDIDELFGVVFKSMMRGFYISVRKGEFNSLDNDEFTEKCIQVVQKTSDAISDFLNLFAISECTSSMGYNLYYKYDREKDIEKYNPIISVLLKTNMLKVMPYVYYRHLELEYYCSTNLPVWENDLSKIYDEQQKFEDYEQTLENHKKMGNVLLLRNRAENYLRENMYVDINIEKEDES